MANKTLVRLLQDKYRQGVEDGWVSFSLVSVLGGYNVCDDFFESDEKYFEFFKRFEKECVRIFEEECKGDPENATLATLFHTNELRKKMGLKEIE